jgi:TatD DNase family protein
MTYSGSRRIRELAASLPLSAIVLETDAPDIPPAWCGGRRNDPANLARFAQELAGLRGMRVEEVIAATGANAIAAIPGLAGLVLRSEPAPPASGCGQ